MQTKSFYLKLASAPALALFQNSPEESAQHGTILFYHGFGASKDQYIEVLTRFAIAGFLVIGIDGVGHGKRRYPDFAERFPPIQPPLIGDIQLEAAFLSVVRATTQEIPMIIDALSEQEWIHDGRLGISGHSFGGFVTYAAVVAEKRIRVAAPVVGSPQWKLPWPESPHLHLDQFFPTALLSQTAANDTRVLPDFARDLHQHLVSYYVQAPERLRYIEYQDSTHDLSIQDWQQAWENVVNWFERFMPRK